MKKGHGSKFGRKKEAAIGALLSEKNHAEAARVAGIDLKTLKRWMRLPEFIEEWRRARWEGMEQAYARAQQNSGACISGSIEADGRSRHAHVRSDTGRIRHIQYRAGRVEFGDRNARGGTRAGPRASQVLGALKSP
jgi:hypothetical protein